MEGREVFREGGELVVGESEGCMCGEVKWGECSNSFKEFMEWRQCCVYLQRVKVLGVNDSVSVV